MSGALSAAVELFGHAVGVGVAIGVVAGSLLSAALWLIAFRR